MTKSVQGSAACGFSPGGPHLLPFFRGACKAYGQAEAVGIIVKQMIHVEGVQSFGPCGGGPQACPCPGGGPCRLLTHT